MTPDELLDYLTPDELHDYLERLLDETDQDQLWCNLKIVASFNALLDERP